MFNVIPVVFKLGKFPHNRLRLYANEYEIECCCERWSGFLLVQKIHSWIRIWKM